MSLHLGVEQAITRRQARHIAWVDYVFLRVAALGKRVPHPTRSLFRSVLTTAAQLSVCDSELDLLLDSQSHDVDSLLSRPAGNLPPEILIIIARLVRLDKNPSDSAYPRGTEAHIALRAQQDGTLLISLL